MSKEYDKRVITLMTQIYCNGLHCGVSLCDDCRDFLAYAHRRIDRCPLGEKKASCRTCAIHCYTPEYRNRAKDIMRYAGPRMVFKHPLMTIVHFIKEMC